MDTATGRRSLARVISGLRGFASKRLTAQTDGEGTGAEVGHPGLKADLVLAQKQNRRACPFKGLLVDGGAVAGTDDTPVAVQVFVFAFF